MSKLDAMLQQRDKKLEHQRAEANYYNHKHNEVVLTKDSDIVKLKEQLAI